MAICGEDGMEGQHTPETDLTSRHHDLRETMVGVHGLEICNVMLFGLPQDGWTLVASLNE